LPLLPFVWRLLLLLLLLLLRLLLLLLVQGRPGCGRRIDAIQRQLGEMYRPGWLRRPTPRIAARRGVLAAAEVAVAALQKGLHRDDLQAPARLLRSRGTELV
jgi:hypothetical protein